MPPGTFWKFCILGPPVGITQPSCARARAPSWRRRPWIWLSGTWCRAAAFPAARRNLTYHPQTGQRSHMALRHFRPLHSVDDIIEVFATAGEAGHHFMHRSPITAVIDCVTRCLLPILGNRTHLGRSRSLLCRPCRRAPTRRRNAATQVIGGALEAFRVPVAIPGDLAQRPGPLVNRMLGLVRKSVEELLGVFLPLAQRTRFNTRLYRIITRVVNCQELCRGGRAAASARTASPPSLASCCRAPGCRKPPRRCP
jgi:hypothetical protein